VWIGGLPLGVLFFLTLSFSFHRCKYFHSSLMGGLDSITRMEKRGSLPLSKTRNTPSCGGRGSFFSLGPIKVLKVGTFLSAAPSFHF